MDKIILENIKVYAYHGCMQEESKIGSDYVINLEVGANLDVPCGTDELKDTVDYVTLLRVVKEEMAIRSKLLEHVADRIVRRILDHMNTVNWVEIKVSKMNPPINGNISAVSIVRKGKR